MNNDLTILGKFKTVKALKEAYDALEREFTKKCQKLSLLSAKKEENFDGQGVRAEETSAEKTLTKTKPFSSETTSPSVETVATANTVKTFPQGEFFEEAEAVVSDNPDTKNDMDQLTQALASLTPDANFAEKFILSNPQFVELLLARYLKQLSVPTAPRVIGGSGFFSLTPPTRPTSVVEAGVEAIKLFDKK